MTENPGRHLPIRPPSPWIRIVVFVGGLTEIGFSAHRDLILIVSHDGRGVVDFKGTRVARDPDYTGGWFDAQNVRARGIGPLKDEDVAVAGLEGGTVRCATSDGWSVFVKNEGRLYLREPSGTDHLILDEHAIRVACFSPNDEVLAAATADSLFIFSRATA